MLVNNKPFVLKALLKKEASRGVYLIIMLLDYLHIWIPRFCYHTKLSASGNCRMCLIEIKGSIKPLVACCTILNDNLVIYTNTDLIRRSREYIMEFLLINHPLDCPICDQAGECDLQDLALIYGSDDSRFKYKKKAILNKNIDSLIKTTMNRCIYCTRCVRYTSELNNVYLFNTLGRGGFSEIGNYYSHNIVSNNYINGNVIELCPVGALTAKPYSFRNRIWELVSIESIDILDSLCSNIRIDTRNNVVERILPKPNDNLNEEWITDKIRFCYDGFKKQRLSYPFYKYNVSGINTFVLCSWNLLFHKIKVNYKLNFNISYDNSFFHIYTGHLVDVFSLSVLKTIVPLLGITNLNLNLNLNIDLRKYYIFNNNIKTFELNNVFLIFGTNPRVDSPILNMKLRHIKYKYNKKINICYIGSKLILNYSLVHIGINTNSLLKLLYGKTFFCNIIKKIYNIICLFSVGFSLFFNDLLILTLDTLSFFLKKQNFIYSYITLFSGDVSIYELGIVSYYYNKSIFIKNTKPSIYYLLGVDYNNMHIDYSDSNFSIYHGHHGNTGLYNSNIILPSNTYIENTCYFLNCEGRFVVSNVSVSKNKKIINNESIIYNLFTFLNSTSNKINTSLERILILFFYKCSFFFVKFKFLNTLNLNVSNYLKIFSFFFNNSFFTFTNSFFNMDVFSKSSYYILKIKEKENVCNFL